jgi:hypothetical protein
MELPFSRKNNLPDTNKKSLINFNELDFCSKLVNWNEEKEEFSWLGEENPIPLSQLFEEFLHHSQSTNSDIDLRSIEDFIEELFKYLRTVAFRIPEKLYSQKDLLMTIIAQKSDVLSGKKKTLLLNILSSSLSPIKSCLKDPKETTDLQSLSIKKQLSNLSPFSKEVKLFKELPFIKKNKEPEHIQHCVLYSDASVENLKKDHPLIQQVKVNHCELLTKKGWSLLNELSHLKEIIFPKQISLRLEKNKNKKWSLFLGKEVPTHVLPSIIKAFPIAHLYLEKCCNNTLSKILEECYDDLDLELLSFKEVIFSTSQQELFSKVFQSNSNLLSLCFTSCKNLLSSSLEVALTHTPKLRSLNLTLPSDPIEILNLLKKKSANLKELHLFFSLKTPRSLLRSEEFQFLSNCQSLQKLTLIRAPLSPKLLKAITKISSLQELDLSDPLNPGSQEKSAMNNWDLRPLKNLRSLKLNNNFASDKTLKQIRNLPLEQLELNYCQSITSHGWIHLSHLVKLINLSLISCTHLNDKSLQGICNSCLFLETLSLENNLQISPESFRHLNHLNYLKNLNLKNTTANWIAIQAICFAQHLTHLHLSLTSRFPLQAFQRTLETISQHHELKAFEDLVSLYIDSEENDSKLNSLTSLLNDHVKIFPQST